MLGFTEKIIEVDPRDVIPRPTGTYRVYVARNVFNGHGVYADVPIEQSLWYLLSEPSNPEEFYIEIDGNPVPANIMHQVRATAGQTVDIIRIPEGDDLLRVILSVALVVASIYFPPLAGLNAFGTAALQAGILVGGQFLINSLVPFSQPNAEAGTSPAPLQNIGATRNALKPFGVVPRIFGKVRQWPPYAANPYTEVLGNDIWLNALFCIGEGSAFDISDIRIGTTSVTELNHIRIQKTTDPEYPDVFQENLNIEMKQPALDPGGDEATRTTQPNSTRASIDISFPRGLVRFSKDGKRNPFLVDFSVEFRTAGSSDPWQNAKEQDWGVQTTGSVNVGDPREPEYHYIDENENPVTSWKPAPQPQTNPVVASRINPGEWFSFFRSTVDGFRGSVKWTFPSSGTWEIRVKRRATYGTGLTPIIGTHEYYTESRLLDTFLWTALRSFNDAAEAVDSSGDIWYMQLRIKATDQLSGTLDTFNYLVEAYTRTYNGIAWIAPTKNRSPAWAFAEVLTGKSTALPVEDSSLLASDLRNWDTWCTANGFTLDFEFIEERSMFEVLGLIVSAGRAAFSQREGNFTVITDNVAADPVQIFTRRNSANFNGTRVFLDELHGVKVRYRSESEDYQWTERNVYKTGFTETTATNLEVLELLGVVNDDQAYKMSLRYMAELIHRPEFYFLQADLEHLIAQRGDTVMVQNEFMLVGVGSARIADITGSVVTLDAGFLVESTKSYLLRFRSDRGQQPNIVSVGITTANVTSPASGTDISVFTVDSVPADVKVGDLIVFGESGTDVLRCKVLEIEPRDDLKANISLTLEASAVYTAMEGDIPDYVPVITSIPDPSSLVPPTPSIIEIFSEGTGTTAADGRINLRVEVTYNIDLIGAGYSGPLWVQVAYREFEEGDEDGIAGGLVFTEWTPYDQSAIIINELDDGKRYQFFIRSKTIHNSVSLFSFAKEHVVTGAPSSSVEGVDLFSLTPLPEAVLVSLDLTSLITLNASYVEITYSTTNNRDTPTPTLAVFPLPTDLNTLSNLDIVVPIADNTLRYYWVRIFNIYGNVSNYYPLSSTAGLTENAGVVQVAYQSTPPTNGVAGDIWIDSDDNQMYRHNGTSFVAIQDTQIGDAIADASNAQGTADNKVYIFAQDVAPVNGDHPEGLLEVGDLWIETDNDNQLYRWSGSVWTNYRDGGISTALSDASNAQATADGKITTFFQTSAPTAEGVGDLWVDTNDNDRLYRWSGSSWVDIRDGTIAIAQADAATGIANAATAQSTADGKIVTFVQTSAPTADGVGDLWMDTNDNNKMYRWSGSAWVEYAQEAADWALVFGTGQPDDYAASNQPSLGGIIYNSSMLIQDFERDRAAGWFLADGTGARLDYEDANKTVMALYGSGDTSVSVGSTAFPVTFGQNYHGRVRVKHTGVSARTTYLRIMELDGDLPEGKIAIRRGTAGPTYDEGFTTVATRTAGVTVASMNPVEVPTTWTEYEFDYTPTNAATIWASLALLNWDATVGELHVDRVSLALEATDNGATVDEEGDLTGIMGVVPGGAIIFVEDLVLVHSVTSHLSFGIQIGLAGGNEDATKRTIITEKETQGDVQEYRWLNFADPNDWEIRLNQNSITNGSFAAAFLNLATWYDINAMTGSEVNFRWEFNVNQDSTGTFDGDIVIRLKADTSVSFTFNVDFTLTDT